MKLIACALIVLSFNQALATENSCDHCSELRAVETETRKESKKKTFDVDALQLRATAIIQKMTDKKKPLTSEQVRLILQTFLASITHDPARAIIENNIDAIQSNRSLFDHEIAKLPKADSTALREAIDISLSTDAEGTDPQ